MIVNGDNTASCNPEEGCLPLGKRIKSRNASQPRYTCKDVSSLLADYLTANIPKKVRVAFDDHLAQCPDCVAFLRTYKKTVDIMKDFLNAQSLLQRPRKERVSLRNRRPRKN